MKSSRLILSMAILASTMLAGVSVPALAEEGALAGLYAPRPPAGSSFLRILNPGEAPLRVKIADGPEQELGGGTIASKYAIVKGGTPLIIEIDGVKSPAIEVGPDSFTSLVPKQANGAISFTRIDDSSSGGDALKAELRFYNLATDCPAGELKVSPSGPVLFSAVAPEGVASRSINPVRAELVASCGAAPSPPLALPRLEPGDHYSLFLTGTAEKPVLHGQVNATETYQRK